MIETIRIPLGASGNPVGWTTVDLADYERLIIHRWYLAGRGYAFRPLPDGKSVFMHREVLGFPDTEDVHHRNGNKLDNRRGNLQECTHRDHMRGSPHATVFQSRERIRELRLDGWTNGAIAAELGISVAGVVKHGSDLPKAPHPRLVWTPDRLIESVQKFHAEHGRVPRQEDLNGKNGMPWFTTVYRRFSGFRELVEASGFEYVDGRSRRAA